MASLPPDPWKALGLEKTADKTQIRTAYKKLVLKCHPDKVSDPVLKAQKQEEFQLIQQAYELLSDDADRTRYEDMVRLSELRKEMATVTETTPRSAFAYNVTAATRRAEYGERREAKEWERVRERHEEMPPKLKRDEEIPLKLRERGRKDREERERARRDRERRGERSRERKPRPPYIEDDESDGIWAKKKEKETKDDIYGAKRERDLDIAAAYISRSRREREKQEEEVKRERGIEQERNDFVKFALKLFEETKGGREPAASTAKNSEKKGPTADPEAKPKQRSAENQSQVTEDQPTVQRSDVQPEPGPDPKQASTKAEKLFAVPPEQLNLEQMNAGIENALVDIVAVHGLGAIPDITWKEKKSGTVWLSDERMLPAAVPKARILRFGYDSLWMGDTPIRTTLSTIAIKLLLCLSVARAEDLERPLIFLGHCFGGLVIQRALILAKLQPNKHPSLFDSCVGVVFLGAPHRGSGSFTQESALLTAIAASSDLYKNVEAGVLETMTSKSGSLLDVADDFITLCVNGGPRVSCFFEQRSSKLGKVIGRNDIDEFIVDAKSATFDGHPKYGLEVDHFGLNKFDSPTNPNYIQVRAVIVDFYREALGQTSRRATTAPVPPAVRASSAAENAPSRTRNRVKRPGLEAQRPQLRPNSSRSQNPTIEDQEDVEEIRKKAIKALHEEEARKSAALRELEYQARSAKEKRAAEQAYCERLKKNMQKYGVADPDATLQAHPLPADADLNSEQEVHDKARWHRNMLKGLLLNEGLDGGQIDEVLNDTGRTMIVDGVETAFTKMAAKWVSTHTLDAYDIPWQRDKDDRSTIIITRWVPEYEQEFIWDHSQALRSGRERRRDGAAGAGKTKERTDTKANAEEYREEQGKAWLLRGWEKFREAARRESATATTKNVFTPAMRHPDDVAAYPEFVPRNPPHRSASVESMRSAPDMEEVSRRRRNSRTLSRGSSPSRVYYHNRDDVPSHHPKARSSSWDDAARITPTRSGSALAKDPDDSRVPPHLPPFKVKESKPFYRDNIKYADPPSSYSDYKWAY